MKDTPAFPSKQKALMIKSEHIDIASEYEIEHNGMTLRDYFAAKALQGMLAACTGWSEAQQERLTKCSYAMADEMMKAREA